MNMTFLNSAFREAGFVCHQTRYTCSYAAGPLTLGLKPKDGGFYESQRPSLSNQCITEIRA
jgi:hypothetical protein